MHRNVLYYLTIKAINLLSINYVLMPVLKFIASMMLGGLLVFCLEACNSNRQKKIIGKWVLADQKIDCSDPLQDSIQKSRINVYKNGLEILKEDVEDVLSSRMTYVFFEDNRFALLSVKDSEDGHYYFKDSNLVLTNDSKLIIGNYQLISLTDTTITLKEGIAMPKHTHNKISFLTRK